jgi:hypothetical protein
VFPPLGPNEPINTYFGSIITWLGAFWNWLVQTFSFL